MAITNPAAAKAVEAAKAAKAARAVKVGIINYNDFAIYFKLQRDYKLIKANRNKLYIILKKSIRRLGYILAIYNIENKYPSEFNQPFKEFKELYINQIS